MELMNNMDFKLKEITYDGDLLTSNADIICHQVNPYAMGAGIAKQIKEKYPRVYQKFKEASDKGLIKLGTCQVIKTNPGSENNKLVANLCGQEKISNTGERCTNYEGIYCALKKLADYCKTNNIQSVAFPKYMSCGLGGADWWIIVAMIESVFKELEILIEYWNYKKTSD